MILTCQNIETQEENKLSYKKNKKLEYEFFWKQATIKERKIIKYKPINHTKI